MKFETQGAALAAAATSAKKVAPARPPVTTMAGVLITAGESITLCAYNDAVFSTTQLGGVALDDGTVLVSAQALAEIAGVIPPTRDVTLWVEDDRLEIRCGRYEWSLPTLDASYWPDFPQPGEPAGQLPGEAFVNAAARVLPAAATDLTGDAAYCCVRCEFTGGQLTLVTTNRYRVAMVHPPGWRPVLGEAPPESISMPLEVIKFATDAAKGGGDVEIGTNGSVGWVTTEGSSIVGHLLDLPYVDWATPMAAPLKTPSATVVVEVDQLKQDLRIPAAVMNKHDSCQIEVGPEVMEVSKHGSTEKTGRATLDHHGYSGDEPTTVVVQPEYLRDGVTCLGGVAYMKITFTGSRSPMLFQPCNSRGETPEGLTGEAAYMVMPLKR